MNKKAEFRISLFIIALILVGAVATTITMMTGNLSDKYGTDYDNETLQVFEDTSELNDLAVELEAKTNTQTVESGVFDVVGAWIGRALDALKLSASSYSVFEGMTETAVNKVGIPGYFKIAALSIMMILIVFAIIAVMVKWLV